MAQATNTPTLAPFQQALSVSTKYNLGDILLYRYSPSHGYGMCRKVIEIPVVSGVLCYRLRSCNDNGREYKYGCIVEPVAQVDANVAYTKVGFAPVGLTFKANTPEGIKNRKISTLRRKVKIACDELNDYDREAFLETLAKMVLDFTPQEFQDAVKKLETN